MGGNLEIDNICNGRNNFGDLVVRKGINVLVDSDNFGIINVDNQLALPILWL